ncbi:MAG: CPBP family intramembrane metalloprotease, partial [Jiangellaceae bacterium]|nr:CPBP family intramembrane metalloprotease [Jiangellaceae bacterium]
MRTLPMPVRRLPPEAVGAAVLALHNVAVHRVLPRPVGAALNMATAYALTVYAGRTGCTRADLGISAADVGSGVRTGIPAAAAAAGAVAGVAALPATRRFFHDRRVADVRRAVAAYHVVVRIPLATAVAEELLFRGVLLALFRHRRGDGVAVLWTSLLFGAWHVLPAIDHYFGNAVSALVADSRRGLRTAVLAAMALTTAAGGVFAWLRLRSSSVLAPALTHAAV